MTSVGAGRSALDDAQLVARCRAGDEAAWALLVDRFSRYVYSISTGAFRLSEPDAEDVFQEVFTRVYTRLDKLRDDSALRPWIGQLTRRLCIDRLRSVRIAGAEARVRQYPHEFSGGMRQRAVIAMGLMIDPRLTIADEPTTALDVTVQQQILRLLRQVTEARDAAALFISHDVAVVSQLCSRVVVMYAGRVVEELDVERLVDAPAHPYTAALIASVPTMESDRSQPLATIPGRAPGPFARSPGCPFASRCPIATDRCRAERPPLDPLEPGHRVACWYPLTSAESRARAEAEGRRQDVLA